MSLLKQRTHKVLRGNALLEALAATQVPVRLRNGSNDAGASISPEDAIRLVLRSSWGFEGKARTGRVYWLRATSGKPVECDPTHWDERACIRFHADQTTVPLKCKNKRAAAAWTRMATSPPAYMKSTPQTV